MTGIGLAASTQKKLFSSGALEGNEMVISLLYSQKPRLDLMQNCDLPPPVKVFAESDKNVSSAMNRICGMMGQEDKNTEFRNCTTGVGENGKLELLKALRLSQTRAREAERKAAALAKERDWLSNALIEESSRLFGYSQWMKMMEIQLSKLQKKPQEKNFCAYGARNRDDDEREGSGSSVSCFVALAICLGITGVGVAIGYSYFFG